MWQKQELQNLTGFQVIWITAGRVRSSVMLKWSKKKIPNKVLIHIVMGSLHVPIFQYLGFLKILHGTGEDLVYEVEACAVLVTAQMQVFFALSAAGFYAGQTQGLIHKQSHANIANRFFMDLVKPLQQTMWTS